MKVTLLSKTEDPERTCAAAAWVCTHDEPKLPSDFTFTDACALVKRVVAYGHEGILEAATATILVENIDRATSHQLVRTRIASYHQKSQRYTKLQNEGKWFSTPEEIAANEKANMAFMRHMCMVSELYQTYIEMGIPAEAARAVLPNAALTNIVITMNMRMWNTFLDQRLCLKAQTPIREMAGAIYNELKAYVPALLLDRLPNCGSKGECKNCKGIRQGAQGTR